MCFRPVPQIKTLRSPQARKNEIAKPNARSQRTAVTGKRPDPRATKKDEKSRPVKKEDKKEDNKVKAWRLLITVVHSPEVAYHIYCSDCGLSLLGGYQHVGETYCLHFRVAVSRMSLQKGYVGELQGDGVI